MARRPVDPATRHLAKTQRRLSTAAETLLWRDLRDRRCGGEKFRRQVAVGPYVADFVCFDRSLIVELDGPPHDEPGQREHDAKRDQWLTEQGFMILRFPNDLLLGGSGELVLNAIRQALRGVPSSDLR